MTRRLAAILAADIVGYSRLMGEDEAGTVETLRKLRSEILNPVLSEYGGTLLKSMGDGWLAEFTSAVAAVNAAMQLQDRLARHQSIRLRIGLHIGDITHTEDDFYGDGVNIAARLEALAPPGGILISDAVYSSLDGTLSPSFEEAGGRRLRNIAREVQTWVRGPALPAGTPQRPDAQARAAAFPRLTLAPVRSGLAQAATQELAHALTADLVTFFGGIAWLATSVSEDPAPDGYALHSTLRAQGDRIRLETRLTDPRGGVLWADKSDGQLADSFDWQDRVVEHVAGTTTDLILEAETMALAAIPDDQLEPEQCLLMGMMAWKTFANDAFAEALAFQARAIAARPDLADAYAEAIIVVCAGRTMGPDARLAAYLETLPLWVEAARPLASGHAMLTLAIAIADYLADKRAAPLNRTVSQVLRMAPFDARLLSFCGWAYIWSGDPRTALDCFEKSIRLGRLGPFIVASHGGAATAAVQLNMPRLALDHCAAGLRQSDSYPTLYSTKSAALALLGDTEAAGEVMSRYRALMPDRTLRSWRASNDYGQSEGGERYFDALRRAGLPEG